MAYIFGVATQEGDLYKILRDFLAGAATPGQTTYSGTGTGELNNLRMNPKSDGAYETYVLTCESVAPRGGTFGVVGSVSGVLPDATVGTVYKTTNIEFYLDFGDVDFALGDRFTITAMTGNPSKPRFANVMGGPEMGTDTVTITCVQPESIDPPVPAIFSVSATSIGGLPDLTQGQWYRNPYLTLLLEKGTAASRFEVGDEFQIPFTRNPLRQVNQHWEVLRKAEITNPSQFGASVPDMDAELVMRGPGLTGDDSVYWGMTRHWDDSTAAAWWVHHGMGGYIPNMAMNEQALVQGGQTGVRPIHTFWSLNVPYTIIASGRCFKLLTRSNIYYSQSYQGLMLPSSMPKYYGYPYFSGGTGTTRSTMWSALGIGRSSFWNYLGNTQNAGTREESSAYVVKDSRMWGAINGSWMEFSSAPVRPNFSPNISYPYAHQGMYDLRTNLDGTVPLFPVQLSPNLGQLDGVFAVPGRDGRQPEEILVNRDGSRALVVQNHHRSGFNDFCAFTLE